MFSSTITAGLVLGLFQIPNGVAKPVNAGSFIITHIASNYFPHAKSDLSRFDVDVQFVGYSDNTQSWLTGLDPASGNSDEEKAILITAAAHAKPFDTNDRGMIEDVDSLLAAINGTFTSLRKRGDGSNFQVETAHAINWASCADTFSCLSGTTCGFSLDIGKAPRSQCSEQGGSNCCVSWPNYSVREGFFTSAWTICNDEVHA